ncbi:tail protein X [Streptomyces sp. NPDC059468]|uniref:tail protein X n=1 Tax=Streptomyces sp. NPDC059468 TaxID=3346845 RepID=UPI00369E1F97
MTISANSRYKDSNLALVASSRGTNLTVVPSRQQEWAFQFTYHQVTSSDRIDLLAEHYYGDPLLWWNISDANPEIMTWDVLPVGATIRIPSV